MEVSDGETIDVVSEQLASVTQGGSCERGHADRTSLIARQRSVTEHLRKLERTASARGVVTFFGNAVALNEVASLAEIRVTVLPEGEEPFEALLIATVLHAREHEYAPGRTVRVRYDPADLAKVHFDESWRAHHAAWRSR